MISFRFTGQGRADRGQGGDDTAFDREADATAGDDQEIGRFSHLEHTDSHGGESLDRGKPAAAVKRPSASLPKRLANPKRKRKQAVDYPTQRLSWCLWGAALALSSFTGLPRGARPAGLIPAPAGSR